MRRDLCIPLASIHPSIHQVADSVLAMDTSSDGGPAASRGKEGGGVNGDKDSLRDVIDQIHSVTSRMAAKTEAADLQISDADSNTEACVSLAARLSGLLETLTDADSTLSNELAQIPPNTQNKERKDGDGRLVRWLYNIHDEASKAVYLSKAVSAGDGKGSQVGASPAAAAAASSGGASVGVFGATAAAATHQHTGSSQDHGRPCLPGLPAAVMGTMGSFLTTIDNITRLTRVNKETHQKATDSTYGVFRHFAVTKDEEGKYNNIPKLRGVKHLGKIRTAHVEASRVVPCVAELLESSSAGLEQLHVADGEKVRWQDDTAPRPPGDPVPFPSLTQLDIQSQKWLKHISQRRWALPALTSLKVDSPSRFDGSSGSFTRLVERSPKIERLEAGFIHFGDDDWPNFLVALGGCPHLTHITGLGIPGNQLDRIKELKEALNKHWAKQERKGVRKKLGFVVSSTMIHADCRQGAADLQGISEWAAEVSCELEWRPFGDSLTVDCSSDTEEASCAPDGLYGEIAKQLASKATEVRLALGGTTLHESWRDKLIFPRASSLGIEIKESSSGSSVVDSIPEWLTEREGEGEGATSRHFPAVEQLVVSFGELSFSDLPSAPSKLSRLVGGLAGLERVFFSDLSSASVACELLSYLSVPRLSEVEIAEPLSHEWPASVPAEWSFRSPPIERLVTAPLEVDPDQWSSKEGVHLFLQLVSTLRPSRVDLTAILHDDELEGEGEGEQGDDASRLLQAARAFAWECNDRVQALYTMTGGSCEQVDVEQYRLTMQLAAK
ncbi:unnamed protein product [Vitrella brassicaformis CCMP3155]|uniref:Uncharacterized protein n=2 Tax=Vitrella brassicaformis TaxID=1169539 RepID=A0A0G4FCK9_VITBC|nr:unnamed protein product [Vitrella brassicaformis CCMP3155]|eukprot:CEM10960.1 unnamed protein product [Vitrella brassicaformis CCMP3155]